MAEVGRPTDLTDELIKEIKQQILDGKNIKDTAKHIFNNYAEISEKEKENGESNYIQKLYNWKSENYLNIGDKIEGWQRDRKLAKAEGILEEMLDMPIQTLQWQGRGNQAEQVVITDVGLVRTKQDTAKFVAETLGKRNYSKRTELSGVDGKDLIPKQDVQSAINNLQESSEGDNASSEE